MTELRIREAVRALVIDQHDRVLLVRFEFPTATRWAPPGGGLDAGEDHLQALRRELAEELGLTEFEVGHHLWNRLHIVPFINGLYDGQRDRVYLVRVAHFEPAPQLSWAQLNAEFVHELRWWTADELLASDAVFAPSGLPQLVASVLREGPAAAPIDVEP